MRVREESRDRDERGERGGVREGEWLESKERVKGERGGGREGGGREEREMEREREL